MPSFIVATKGQLIFNKKDKAEQLGITVAGYKVTNTRQPKKEEFSQFLEEFEKFCIANNRAQCDTLLFTGSHGESNPPPFFNNLREEQIDLIIKTAKDNNVTFDHIVADCCCAPYGLNRLKGLLADGGELIGDRTTSTNHWNHSTIMDDIDIATSGEELMHNAIKRSLNNYNAPLIVTRNKDEFTSHGTNIEEVFAKKGEQYEAFLGHIPSRAEIDVIFPEDAHLLKNDLIVSKALFKFTEFDTRAEMITLREARLAKIAQVPVDVIPTADEAQAAADAELARTMPREESLDLVPMEESDISSISALDLRVFPDEDPLGEDRLLNVCKKGFSSVIKSSATNQPVGYVFVNPTGKKLWVDNIGVSPDHTRKGIGKRLLNKVINLADKENKEVGLQVRASNKGAISLYTKAGFQITSAGSTWLTMARAPQLILQSNAAVEAQIAADAELARTLTLEEPVEAQIAADAELARKLTQVDAKTTNSKRLLISKFDECLGEIDKKCESLEKRGEVSASTQAREYLNNLKTYRNEFKDGNISRDNFKSKCLEQLDQVKSSLLANHRGFLSKIFNSLLNLLGVKTDTEQKFKNLQKTFFKKELDEVVNNNKNGFVSKP